MLIRILFADSSCRNVAHEEVRGIAEEAMEDLGKKREKNDAKPGRLI
jgi:hypothetical protein